MRCKKEVVSSIKYSERMKQSSNPFRRRRRVASNQFRMSEGAAARDKKWRGASLSLQSFGVLLKSLTGDDMEADMGVSMPDRCDDDDDDHDELTFWRQWVMSTRLPPTRLIISFRLIGACSSCL